MLHVDLCPHTGTIPVQCAARPKLTPAPRTAALLLFLPFSQRRKRILLQLHFSRRFQWDLLGGSMPGSG